MKSFTGDYIPINSYTNKLVGRRLRCFKTSQQIRLTGNLFCPSYVVSAPTFSLQRCMVTIYSLNVRSENKFFYFHFFSSIIWFNFIGQKLKISSVSFCKC